jgi:type IV pilus assembly protein PilA
MSTTEPVVPALSRADEDAAFVETGERYYLPLFERFDSGGSTASWNWPAFFFTSGWMLFRKMWGVGLAYVLVAPVIAIVLIGIGSAALGAAGAVVMLVLTTVFFWIVAPIFANYFYWRHARSEMRTISNRLTGGDRLHVIERRGGTTFWGPVLLVVCGLFPLGILSAIAIPAYQDYTIRSQVTEGLVLAAASKAAVAEQYARDGTWPSIPASAPSNAQFVSSIEVQDGTVLVTFGRRANGLIAGKALAIAPGVDGAGEVVWACGDVAHADGVTAGPGPAGSEVPPKYLPRNCRPN